MIKKQLANVSTRKFIEVNQFSENDQRTISTATKILGLRKPEFYRRAIVEKANSVLQEVSNEQ